MQLYIKVPETLLDEGSDIVYQYCQIYLQLLQRRRLNVAKWSRTYNVSYQTTRRLKAIALTNINTNGVSNDQSRTK